MSLLFEPYRIENMELKNRFMRSATTSAWSDDRGVLRSEILDLYRKLAEGGVGLIVTGHLYIMDAGKAHIGMAGISNDDHISMLRKLVEPIHQYDCKIIAQLNHAGIFSIIDRAGPSEYIQADSWKARALSSDEIHSIIVAFGDAAERAMDAGFDGVQIHGAHGYLISQFLSRLVNIRSDEYGGDLESRMQLLFEVYDEIRARVGGCIPVMVKINCDDFSMNGFTIEDSIKVAKALLGRGVNAIEVSGGGGGAARRQDLRERARSLDSEVAEAAFAGHAQRVRDATKPRPMALVNGIRSRKCMEAIIKKDLADIISLSRPFIREPNLVTLLKEGQPNVSCISCDKCGSRTIFGKMMLRCHQD